MPILKNAKHESFCQAYARGPHAGNCVAAYQAAGFSGDSANASKFRRRSDIDMRIAELQAQHAEVEHRSTQLATERLAIAKEGVFAEYGRIAFANILDYVGPDGDVDLTLVSREAAAAIDEFVVDYHDARGRDDDGGTGRVKRVRIKLADKISALDRLSRHFGLFVGTPEPVSPLAHLTDEELHQELAAQIKRLVDAGVDVPALLPKPGTPG